jgi:hypothetical protein
MAQDIRELFEKEQQLSKEKMPKGHQARFLQKLEEELPEHGKQNTRFSFFSIAASVVLLISVGFFGARVIGDGGEVVDPMEGKEIVETKPTIGEISPQLKKVEDYYLANINLELSKLEYTPESKELFDGYVSRMDELSKEYERLADELIASGPNERTVTALIDNLKLRLNLLYRLKEKLSELNSAKATYTESQG